jgi:hypothetical protein
MGWLGVRLTPLLPPPTAAVEVVVDEEAAGFMAGFMAALEGFEGFEGFTTCSCLACICHTVPIMTAGHLFVCCCL